MSAIHFLILPDNGLTKTKYSYRYILPRLKSEDMFANGEISFKKELTDQEKAVVLDKFSAYNVYVVHSDFGLSYEVRNRNIISRDFANNSFDELVWFKNFIKKLLRKNEFVLFIPTSYNCPVKTSALKPKYMKQIEINDWILSEEQDANFTGGTIYKFT